MRSYLTRGCLVERELCGRLVRGHRASEELRKKNAASGAEADAELDQVVKELSVKQAELDDWRRETEAKDQAIAELKAQSDQKSVKIEELRRRLQAERERPESTNEVFRERDLAVVQVALEKQVAQHAKAQWEELSVEAERLRGECAWLRESLSKAEEKVGSLESSDHESAILERNWPVVIEEFRNSLLGKVEVALACKAGCDFIIKQLSTEFQDVPGRLEYPPCIAGRIGILSKCEEAGAGLDLGAGEDEGEGESLSDGSSSEADVD